MKTHKSSQEMLDEFFATEKGKKVKECMDDLKLKEIRKKESGNKSDAEIISGGKKRMLNIVSDKMHHVRNRAGVRNADLFNGVKHNSVQSRMTNVISIKMALLRAQGH